jgi:D-psicose/D-tagatose/L-ribulose 3-epimerase
VTPVPASTYDCDIHMKLAVSNLAWSDDRLALPLLKKAGILNLEIAPTKVFGDWRFTDADASWYAGRLRDQGFAIVAFQSICFGIQGNLFDSPNVILDHLTTVIKRAETMGATKLVFGSPAIRERNGRPLDRAIYFFKRLAKIAGDHGVKVCLEPNAPCYDCDFLTTALETAEFVKMIGHRSLRMVLDTGCMTLVSDIGAITKFGKGFYKNGILEHFHISELELAEIGSGIRVKHVDFARELQDINYQGYATLEMREGDLATAVNFAKSVYITKDPAMFTAEYMHLPFPQFVSPKRIH